MEDDQKFPRGCPRAKPASLAKFNNDVPGVIQELLQQTCFSQFFMLESCTFASSLYTALISRFIPPNKFTIMRHTLEFTHRDVELILGLRTTGDLDLGDLEKTQLRRDLCPNDEAEVRSTDLLNCMNNLDSSTMRQREKFVKLALLYVIGIFLLSNDSNSVEAKYIDLVDDLPRFSRQPWGKIVYHALIEEFSTSSCKIQGKAKMYNIWRCSHVLLIWAYEHIISVRPSDQLDPEPQFPRILKWTSSKYYTSQRYERILTRLPKYDMHLTLTDAETQLGWIVEDHRNDPYCENYDIDTDEEQLVTVPKKVFETLQDDVELLKKQLRVLQDKKDKGASSSSPPSSKKPSLPQRIKKPTSSSSDSEGILDDFISTKRETPNIPSPLEKSVLLKHKVNVRNPLVLARRVNPRRDQMLEGSQHENLGMTSFTKKEESLVDRTLKNLEKNENMILPSGAMGKSLKSLMPGEWIDDLVVDYYSVLLKERERRYPTYFDTCHFFRAYFMNYLKLYQNREMRKSLVATYSNTQLQYDIGQCQKIFIPFNIPGNHWALLYLHLESQTMYLLDSLGKQSVRRWDEQIKLIKSQLDLMLEELGHTPLSLAQWKFVVDNDIPLQTNGDDCGVFMLKYIDFLCRTGVKNLPFSQENMLYFRRRLQLEIIAWEANP